MNVRHNEMAGCGDVFSRLETHTLEHCRRHLAGQGFLSLPRIPGTSSVITLYQPPVDSL